MSTGWRSRARRKRSFFNVLMVIRVLFGNGRDFTPFHWIWGMTIGYRDWVCPGSGNRPVVTFFLGIRWKLPVPLFQHLALLAVDVQTVLVRHVEHGPRDAPRPPAGSTRRLRKSTSKSQPLYLWFSPSMMPKAMAPRVWLTSLRAGYMLCMSDSMRLKRGLLWRHCSRLPQRSFSSPSSWDRRARHSRCGRKGGISGHNRGLATVGVDTLPVAAQAVQIIALGWARAGGGAREPV